MAIDDHAHEELHGNRYLRALAIANKIARFLNVESHAKDALDWLTQAVKDTLFGTWKMVTGFLQAVSNKVQKILGFGPDEEPPPGSIMEMESPPEDGSIPIF